MKDLFKLLIQMTLAIPTAIVGFFIYVILLLVGKLYEGPAKPKLSLTMLLTVSDGTTYKGNHMSLIIRNDQEISFNLLFEDTYGNVVTKLGSVPNWTISDAELASIEASEDGMSAVFKSTGKVGSVQVNVSVDADPEEGVEQLLGQAEVTVLSGKASVIRLSGVISNVAPVVVQPEPETPAEPKPETPVEPEPETPVEPEQPANPETPVDPTQPTTPAEPAPGNGEEGQPA